MEYTGIDRHRFRAVIDEKDRGRVKGTVLTMNLTFWNPEKLKEQLKTALGGEQVDEIHFHMPLDTKWATDPKVLEAIQESLAPGGRFYHIFQHENPSPFLPELKERGSVQANQTETFEENVRRIKQFLEGSGLRLDKYGVKKYTSSSLHFWVTSSKQTQEPTPYKDFKMNRLVGESMFTDNEFGYTGAYGNADHFVILRKAKN